EAFAIAKRQRIPWAPVRDVDEVMVDRHMHERGMLRMDRARRDRPHRRAVDAATHPRRRPGRYRAQPEARPAQLRDLRRLARIVGRRYRHARTRQCHLSRPGSRQPAPTFSTAPLRCSRFILDPTCSRIAGHKIACPISKPLVVITRPAMSRCSCSPAEVLRTLMLIGVFWTTRRTRFWVTGDPGSCLGKNYSNR